MKHTDIHADETFGEPPQSANASFKNMILSDSAMSDIIETISRISFFDSTILITGESGTGKSMLAQYIHNSSKRAGKPFVTINCATIPESLIESELFGYVSGAFTSANEKGKAGMIELADTGTLFLDEIGLLPYNLQAKFLQLIQEKTFTPIGSTKSKTVDVRIISATNLDLKEQIAAKLFREDLYYRLRVVEFEMPPLRKRLDAIDSLIDYFITAYNEKFGLSKAITNQGREVLRAHSWRGNIRELQYILERLVITSPNNLIVADDIPPLMDHVDFSQKSTSAEFDFGEISFDEAVAAFERNLLLDAYKKYKSSYKIADALKISQTRASRLLRKYGIGS